MSNRAMNNVQRAIRENTCDMDTETYISFMQELSEWANSQADMADYAQDFNEDE